MAMDRLTRRSVLTLVGGTAAALGIAACGGRGPSGAGPGAPGTDGFPVTVAHTLGETVIETRPARVVSLGYSDADAVLALGVQPVGVHTGYSFATGVGPWAVPKLATPRPVIWKGRTFNYEAIAGLRPDLILDVTDSGDRTTYEILSKIAPTVALPVGAVPHGAPWQDTTRLIGRSLGLAAQGDELVTATLAYLARIAAENPAFAGRTLTYLDIYPGGMAIGGEPANVVQTMRRLGFVQSPVLRGPEWGRSQNPISPELLSKADADVILIFGFGSDQQQVLAANPTLANLPAVKAGRVHVLPDLSLSSPSVLSIPYGVDPLVPVLRRMLG
jgi:iron complex transport system substrate-binding protein